MRVKKTPEIARTYRSWYSMRRRCYSPNTNGYARYGGAGIAVCDRWRESFESFLADVGARPEGTTLDRINNDLGYEPGNVRWATLKEQGRNKRANRVVEWRGERRCLAEWAEITGIDFATLHTRMRTGWDVERALTTRPDSTPVKGVPRYTSRTILITANGRTLSAQGWAKEIGCDPSAILWRIHNGWTPERTVSTPPRRVSKCA
jgi:hypothetical protein